MWTPALTERWETEGWRPAVGVWTAAQAAQFLRQVRGHRLYALFYLVALRGLLRGETAGLRWDDLDLGAGTLTVTGQLQQLGGWMVAGPPKSDAGRRVIALDKTAIAALREHRLRQQAERAAAGSWWGETGYVFTTKAGKPFGPDLSEALRAWRDKYPAVTVWQDVVPDHPAHVLASYSARADLVVIGRHNDTGSGLAIGGIQHALLNHARGPAAIVPDA